MRANLDGSNVTVVAEDMATVVFPVDVVLFGNDVYWDNTGYVSPIAVDGSLTGGMPAVGRCPKTGCTGSVDALPYIGPFFYGTGLAVSDAGVFWAGTYGYDTTSSEGQAEVWRIDALDGGTSGPIVIDPGSSDCSLLADGDELYVGPSGPGNEIFGRIAQDAPLAPPDAGNAAFTVLATPSFEILVPHFLVDATTIYYADSFGGVVGGFPKTGLPDGGAPQIVASGLTFPLAIAADDSNLYWTVQGPGTGDSDAAAPPAGAVMTCPKTGCSDAGPTVLAGGLELNEGSHLAVDASYVYFTVPGDGTVRRVAK